MKILITTDWYKPVINGVVTSVVNLKEELEKKGHEVRVLTLSLDGKQYFQEDTYYIKSFGVKIYPQARATYSFKNKYIPEIIDWKPDIIHSQCEWVTFVFAKQIALKLQIPIVHTYHTIYEDYTHYLMKSKKLSKSLVLFSTNHVINATDYVVTPTNKARNLLLSYGITNPIVTVPTGIDLRKYNIQLTPERKKELLAKYNIDENKKVIISLGRLALEKNIDALLFNMLHLKKTRKDILLLIVGGGPYEEELRKTAARLELDDCVKFTGMVPPEEVPEYFRLGEVFVCASQSEAQGLTYVEALACGLPLLCKKDECLEGVLTEGINGWFFEKEEDFEEKIIDMLDNLDDYKKMKQNAEISSVPFSKESFGANIVRVYERAMSNFDGHPLKITKMIRNIVKKEKTSGSRKEKLLKFAHIKKNKNKE